MGGGGKGIWSWWSSSEQRDRLCWCCGTPCWVLGVTFVQLLFASLLLLWSLAWHLVSHGILVGMVVLDTSILSVEHLSPVSDVKQCWLRGQQEEIQGSERSWVFLVKYLDWITAVGIGNCFEMPEPTWWMRCTKTWAVHMQTWAQVELNTKHFSFSASPAKFCQTQLILVFFFF